jgi:hypothetical protein
LTQNEIDAAKSVWVGELNVQNQQRIVWPNKLIVAKAYLDQLERSKGLAPERVARVRQAIEKAESSKKIERAEEPFRVSADGCKQLVGFGSCVSPCWCVEKSGA